MVAMARKEEEDVGPSSRVPHLPWMRYPADIDAFSGCPVAQLPRLDPRLAEALRRMGIESFFPVQVAAWLETIGPGAFQRDLCINSPTGSGKTLAYALPIVQMLSTREVRCLRALVVLPTRDLALQVKEVFDAIAPVVGLSVGSAVGQSSIADEVSDLTKKSKQELYPTLDEEYAQMEPQTKVDILVATPGRLMDHINMTKGFSLEHLQYLVVDETERMLREAYQSWLPTVIQLTRSINQDHCWLDAAGKTLLYPLITMINEEAEISEVTEAIQWSGKNQQQNSNSATPLQQVALTLSVTWNYLRDSMSVQILYLPISEQHKHGGDCFQVRLGMEVRLVPWDPGGNGDYSFVSAWGQASFKEGGMSWTGQALGFDVGCGLWAQEARRDPVGDTRGRREGWKGIEDNYSEQALASSSPRLLPSPNSIPSIPHLLLLLPSLMLLPV